MSILKDLKISHVHVTNVKVVILKQLLNSIVTTFVQLCLVDETSQ